MTLISGENITRQFEDRLLFENLSFSLNENDRIGLVGPNGIGKTTLLDIMAGRGQIDSGTIVRAKNCAIDSIEQELDEKNRITLFDYVASARQDLLELRAAIEQVERELEQDPHAEKHIEKLGDLQHRFEADGGYDFEAEVKLILIGLGFPENRFHDRLSAFSGGEKNR
ncbi:MAG: ABC-F family ATP-binding cassette domain-containing protein, partial [Candidatus Zixiibacteriota bacterium]